MQRYRLKMYGVQPEGATGKRILVNLAFQSSDNLAAIAQAKDAFAEAVPACDRAVISLDDSLVIWEANNPEAELPELISPLLRLGPGR